MSSLSAQLFTVVKFGRLFALCCVLSTLSCTVDEASPDNEVEMPTDGDTSEGDNADDDLSGSYDPLEGYTAPDQTERLRFLRQEHDFASEGDGCERDSDCNSPLRCLTSSICQFPPAMTGVADRATPYVLIETSAGDLVRYFVEIADTQPEQSRGMMNRQLVADEFGMIFVFAADNPRSFWMRNTFVPLDMLFIRSDGEIVSITENAEPLTETSRRSDGPAQYVLELAGGESSRAGITAGDEVEFFLSPE